MVLMIRELQADNPAGRNKWYVFVRLLFLLAAGLPGIISLVLFQGLSAEVRWDSLLLLLGLGSNGIFYALARRRSNAAYQRLLAQIWLTLDIILISAVIYINGAIESRSTVLYAVPILVAGALFGRRATYAAAVASGLLYSALLIADYNQLIPSVGVIDPGLHHQLSYVINSVIFVPSILLVIAMGVDFITNLLTAKEHQATASLQELNRAQYIAHIGSWEWDVRADEIHWSDGMFKILGLPIAQDKISYDSYLKRVHPDDAAVHSRTIKKALSTKKAFAIDHRVVLPDGSIRYMHGEGAPILGADGSVITMYGTAQDVTDARHLDEAKKDFVSLASHQLRTPASGVKAFLSLLLDGYAGDLTPEQREFITKAHSANNRQLDIIENLLNLAAIESGKLVPKKQPVDINDLVKQCLQAHQTTLQANKQKLIINYAKLPVMVDGDPLLLQMVLDNLVSNASKYTPREGQVTVSVGKAKTAALITVADTGIGIESKDLAALFKKFSRLHDPASETVGGSGLGLYIASHVAQLHGGSITVRSRHGEGTAFKIRLPLSSAKRYHKKDDKKTKAA